MSTLIFSFFFFFFFFAASKASSQWDGLDLWIFSSADGFLRKVEKKDGCIEELDLVEVERGQDTIRFGRGFLSDPAVKNLPTTQEIMSSILGLGRFPGEVKGNPLKYSCLENPMDRGASQATVHGIAKELDTT